MTKLLEIRNIGKRYGDFQALTNVSFSVEAGEMVALIGPNGAGKSTCFSIVGGQLAPDGGAVLLAGVNIVGRPVHRLSRMGLGRTFQSAGVFASMSVRENVRLALLAHRGRIFSTLRLMSCLALAEEAEILASLGLEAFADQMCATLSYGDVKRVEIAMALAGRPKILIMDEPAAGMGAPEREAMMTLIRTLAQERNLGILFTEHDVDAAFDCADRVLLLIDGRLVAAGTPAEVRMSPALQERYIGK